MYAYHIATCNPSVEFDDASGEGKMLKQRKRMLKASNIIREGMKTTESSL